MTYNIYIYVIHNKIIRIHTHIYINFGIKYVSGRVVTKTLTFPTVIVYTVLWPTLVLSGSVRFLDTRSGLKGPGQVVCQRETRRKKNVEGGGGLWDVLGRFFRERATQGNGVPQRPRNSLEDSLTEVGRSRERVREVPSW